VVDSGNNRVQKFTKSSDFVTQWPIVSMGRGCAIDSKGNVLVAESGGNVVKRYSNQATFLDSFSQVAPDGIAVSPGNIVW